MAVGAFSPRAEVSRHLQGRSGEAGKLSQGTQHRPFVHSSARAGVPTLLAATGSQAVALSTEHWDPHEISHAQGNHPESHTERGNRGIQTTFLIT